MKVSVSKENLENVSTEALAVALFKEEKLGAKFKEFDRKLNGHLSKLLAKKAFTGETGQCTELLTLGLLPFQRLILAGAGERKKFKPETLRRTAAGVTNFANAKKIKQITFALHTTLEARDAVALGAAEMEGALLANYAFTEYKTELSEKPSLVEEFIFHADKKHAGELAKKVHRAEVLAQAAFQARDWINTPANEKYPELLAGKIKKMAKENGLSCTLYDEKQLKKMGMNGILTIGQGSRHPPRLAVVEYNPKGSITLCLVGKGITFDTGGINTKPFPYMKEMKQDMSGSAAVMATIQAAARLKLPLHVVAIAPIAENMPGGNGVKPGDVYTAYNGKKAEVMHSDAEGRVVLGDALAYAEEKFKPAAILEASTLTGAADVALGRFFAALFTSDEKLRKKIMAAGEETGEWVWELPLVEEMMEFIKGDVADIMNIGKAEGEMGAQMGAAYLSKFVEKTPFAHLDIAPTAYSGENESTRPYLKKGGTGYGVRLFFHVLENWKK